MEGSNKIEERGEREGEAGAPHKRREKRTQRRQPEHAGGEGEGGMKGPKEL